MLSFALLACLVSSAAAHGYLSFPASRGVGSRSESQLGDPLKKFLGCRNERPSSRPTHLPASGTTLRFKIKAGHPGKCRVYLLDTKMGNRRLIGERTNCVNSTGANPWPVKFPAGTKGEQILQFQFEADNKGKREFYENCADVFVDEAGKGPAPKGEKRPAPKGARKQQQPKGNSRNGPAPKRGAPKAANHAAAS